MKCPRCDTNNLQGVDHCSNCACDLSEFDIPCPRDRIERSLMHDTVSVLCPNEGVRFLPSTRLPVAIGTMLEKNIGAVLVVDELGTLIGIFTERDLLQKVAGQVDDYADRTVGEFMTSAPTCVESKVNLAFALNMMDSRGYRHLPFWKTVGPSASFPFAICCDTSQNSVNDHFKIASIG